MVCGYIRLCIELDYPETVPLGARLPPVFGVVRDGCCTIFCPKLANRLSFIKNSLQKNTSDHQTFGQWTAPASPASIGHNGFLSRCFS